MKKLFLLPTLLFFSLPAVIANNGTVRLYFNGTVIQAQQLEEGVINFYYSLQYEPKLQPAGGDNFFQGEKIKVERYFLGTEDRLELITATNYKELIKKYLPNAVELHKRLGKKGFRFENVRYMISYYNKFKS